MKISLFTGGDDPNYAFPLATALAKIGIEVDFIGNDGMQQPEIDNNPKINYLNLRGDQSENAPGHQKVWRILRYYSRILKYTYSSDSKIFHLLWLNKFIYLDRTLINLFYKAFGKKIVFTAHNINERARDGNDSFLNRFSLRIHYNLVNEIIVHTEKMKEELKIRFGITDKKIIVIPFGLNFFIKRSGISTSDARKKLDLPANEKLILFFGRIARYKGLDILVRALPELINRKLNFKLVIAGKINIDAHDYWQQIQSEIDGQNLRDFIEPRIEYIPDDDIELFFNAADVLILPYRHIFQSGPLFMSYYFGLPVIASNVGSFNQEIISKKNGLIFEVENPKSLSGRIVTYFESRMYKNLPDTRKEIIQHAESKYSWDTNAQRISQLYKMLDNRENQITEESVPVTQSNGLKT